MARPAFKALLTKIIPAEAERSTFVLATNIIFVLIFWQWRPIGGTIWQVDNALASALLSGLFWLGWLVVLVTTFLIDHFDLFGLKQVTRYLQKKAPQAPQFKEHSLYKVVRHPIMLGFVIAFWATPSMTAARLFFAIMTTGYILVGLTFEERDLIKRHGEVYLAYARRVPMLIPFLKFGGSAGTPTTEPEKRPTV
jgi:protein-S-isoprenylcysteine O-methyltransferase Ste14